MAQCAGTKRNGEKCTATVEQAQRYCWWHDPDNAEERCRAASKGGRGKASREIRELKKQLEELATDVLAGRVDRGDGAVVNQIINTRARLIEFARKIRETEELEERLEALEKAQEEEGKGAAQRWGA
jgi:hypothetical protein